jgi:hypothetical protein
MMELKIGLLNIAWILELYRYVKSNQHSNQTLNFGNRNSTIQARY